MNATGERGSGCWKIGCIGCGGIAVFAAVLVFGAFGIAKMQIRDEQVEEKVLTHDWLAGQTIEAESATSEGDLSLETTASAGRIGLDLAHANFEIEPGRPGEPLRVEARYDVQSYELEQRSGETDQEIEIRFRRVGSGWLAGIKEMLGGTKPEVRIYLPTDHAYHLDLAISQGGAQANLGGLWLTSADIRFEQGGLDLRFDDPLQAPMEKLSIDGSMGGISISQVGNASPRNLEVFCAMGGMQLDLRGPWQNDAEIRVDARMGGAAMRLPEGVRVVGLAGSGVHLEGEAELDLPVLRFDISSSMGEIEILE